MNSENQNIETYRGDDRTIRVQVKDQDEAAVNLTGAAIKFSVKEKIDDAAYKIQKSSSLSSEILITDASGGEYEIYLEPSDTQNLDIKTYEYDSELATAAGKVYTVLRGEFTVLDEITRP